MQSGLIKKGDLKRKFDNEINANEIVLLAYYIASINAESVYQELTEDHVYRPFGGIVLTDTFQLYEEDKDIIASLLPDNTERRKTQRSRKINVIIGNPPYSAGQKSANDNAANLKYLNLDSRIEDTYAAASTATLKNALYDSYIRAFRLSSDRIGDEGVIGFVTGAGWIEGNATDGMRKCLVEEFDEIYVFNLRGNARTSGEQRRKEKGNVFGAGSRTPIAITILVRKKGVYPKRGQIFYCDIGDYFDRDEKLAIIKLYGSIAGISRENKWEKLIPDNNHDWINQGEKEFESFVALGAKGEKNSAAIFNNYSRGLATSRDAWNYNSSASKVRTNVAATIKFYNSEVDRYVREKQNGKVSNVADFINKDPKRISWTRVEIKGVTVGRRIQFVDDAIQHSLYRPFTKRWLYAHSTFNDQVNQLPHLFPTSSSNNLVIAVTGVGARRFSCLMTDIVPDLQVQFNGQGFPLKLYDKHEASDQGLFARQNSSNEYIVSDGMSDDGLKQFQKAYPKATITKDELFYYIYGLLHSPEYRERFQNNLSKELPRIPAVKSYEGFKAFSDAGRKVGELHVDFEKVDPYPVSYKQGDLRFADISDPKSFYRVQKMKFAGIRGKIDKSTVIYNHNITMTNIPLPAYDYVVNGKSALDWVMERQCVKTDKDSGIVNDANDYANETMNSPAYPLELFQRVITVSLKTMEIVKSLPGLRI